MGQYHLSDWQAIPASLIDCLLHCSEQCMVVLDGVDNLAVDEADTEIAVVEVEIVHLAVVATESSVSVGRDSGDIVVGTVVVVARHALVVLQR